MVRYIKYESVLPSVGTVDPNEPKVIPEWTQIKKNQTQNKPHQNPESKPRVRLMSALLLSWVVLLYVGFSCKKYTCLES